MSLICFACGYCLTHLTLTGLMNRVSYSIRKFWNWNFPPLPIRIFFFFFFIKLDRSISRIPTRSRNIFENVVFLTFFQRYRHKENSNRFCINCIIFSLQLFILITDKQIVISPVVISNHHTLRARASICICISSCRAHLGVQTVGRILVSIQLVLFSSCFVAQCPIKKLIIRARPSSCTPPTIHPFHCEVPSSIVTVFLYLLFDIYVFFSSNIVYFTCTLYISTTISNVDVE